MGGREELGLRSAFWLRFAENEGFGDHGFGLR